MTVEVEDYDGVKVLRLRGELAGGEKDVFVESVTDLLGQPGARLVFDLGGVSFMNSAGLGALVRLVAQANVQEARIILANLSAYITGVVEMTKLNRFFEICPTTQDAVQALA